jgi:hypothetical protein
MAMKNRNEERRTEKQIRVRNGESGSGSESVIGGSRYNLDIPVDTR